MRLKRKPGPSWGGRLPGSIKICFIKNYMTMDRKIEYWTVDWLDYVSQAQEVAHE